MPQPACGHSSVVHPMTEATHKNGTTIGFLGPCLARQGRWTVFLFLLAGCSLPEYSPPLLPVFMREGAYSPRNDDGGRVPNDDTVRDVNGPRPILTVSDQAPVEELPAPKSLPISSDQQSAVSKQDACSTMGPSLNDVIEACL